MIIMSKIYFLGSQRIKMLRKIFNIMLVTMVAWMLLIASPIAFAAGNQSYSQASTYKQDDQNSQASYQESYKGKEDKNTDYNSSSGEQDKSSYQKEQSYKSDEKK
jgi:arylamine N-acetyltransferase